MKFVGHEAALRALPSPLPPVVLLAGPASVGKRWLATLLAHSTGAKGLDLQFHGSLTMETARQMIAFHGQHPMESPVRTSVVDLTFTTLSSVHAVLKILEEPPAYSRFILHTDREPMLTLASRCHVVHMGLLSDDEVREILESRGVHDEQAVKAGRGRIEPALSYVYNREAQGRVEAIVKALDSRNARRLEEALYAALKGDTENPEALRAVMARLLTQTIMASITEEDHVLAFIPLEARRAAIRTLTSKARPAFKVRGAVWTMAAAV